MVTHIARVRINRIRLPQSCSWSDGSSVPRQPDHLYTQAESGAYLLTTGLLLISSAASIYLFKPPYAIVSVPSVSCHAIACRWRSLARVRWCRASKPQRSSSNVCCLCITMGQLICASLSHTHYWYEVGIRIYRLY